MKKNSQQEKPMTPAEVADRATANYKMLAAKAEAAEKLAHAAALSAKKAKAEAVKAVEALRMSAAATIKNFEILDDGVSKRAAALKAQREEV